MSNDKMSIYSTKCQFDMFDILSFDKMYNNQYCPLVPQRTSFKVLCFHFHDCSSIKDINIVTFQLSRAFFRFFINSGAIDRCTEGNDSITGYLRREYENTLQSRSNLLLHKNICLSDSEYWQAEIQWTSNGRPIQGIYEPQVQCARRHGRKTIPYYYSSNIELKL